MRCHSAKGGRVVWDEENLRENAEIQKQYSAVRIAEPKTPYRAPLEADEDHEELAEDMKPLDLDDAGAAAEGAATAKAAVMTAFDFVMSNGGADYTPPGPSRRRAASSTAADEAGDDNPMVDAVGDKRSEPCHSFTSTDSEGCCHSGDPASADKKRRFEAMRKQHYNMKQALQKARQLLASEDEDDEDDTAGWAKGALDGVEGEDGCEALQHEQQEPAGAGVEDEDEPQQQQRRRRQRQRQRQPDGADAAAADAGQAGGGGVQLMEASSSEQVAGLVGGS